MTYKIVYYIGIVISITSLIGAVITFVKLNVLEALKDIFGPSMSRKLKNRSKSNSKVKKTVENKEINAVEVESSLNDDVEKIKLKENLNVNKEAQILLEEDTGLLEEDTGLLEEDTGLLEEDTGLLEDETGLLEDETGLLEDETGLLEDETGLLEDEFIEELEIISTTAKEKI